LKLALFDLDNTLLDFNRSQEFALFATAERFDFSCNHRIYKEFKEINARLWTSFEEGLVSKEKLLLLRFKLLFGEENGERLRAINDHFLQQLTKTKFLMDSAISVLKLVKTKYLVGIVTNGVANIQRSRIHFALLMEHIDHITVSDDVGCGKPDKRIFRKALEKAGITKPHDAIMIGDSFSADILGARRFGMRTCWFNPNGETCPTYDWRPDVTIKSLTEIWPYLSTLARR
jgi:2-haloacid dehalogenase